MNNANHETYKIRLLEMRSRLMRVVPNIEEAIREDIHPPGDVSSVSTHPADHAVTIDENLVAAENEAEILEQVEQALERLEKRASTASASAAAAQSIPSDCGRSPTRRTACVAPENWKPKAPPADFFRPAWHPYCTPAPLPVNIGGAYRSFRPRNPGVLPMSRQTIVVNSCKPRHPSASVTGSPAELKPPKASRPTNRLPWPASASAAKAPAIRPMRPSWAASWPSATSMKNGSTGGQAVSPGPEIHRFPQDARCAGTRASTR